MMRLPSCITVLGLSRSGVAAALLLQRHGYSVLLSEAGTLSEAHQTFVQQLNNGQVPFEVGGHSDRAFQNAELVVLSPGIPPSAAIIKKLETLGLPMMSEVELARHFCPKDFRWIGITGTNGKTTTTYLVSWLLEQAGDWCAPFGGNVGVAASLRVAERLAAATSYTENSRKPQALVVELSSYQLAYSQSLGLDVAILTHIQPDHLEWHGSYEAYAQAKLSLFYNKPEPRWAILNRADATTAALLQSLGSQITVFGDAPPTAEELANEKIALSLWLAPVAHPKEPQQQGIYVRAGHGFEASAKVLGLPFYQPFALLLCEELTLKGSHNMQNMMAAMAVGLIYELPLDRLQAAAASFQGVEHRLEWVAQLPDSKADVYNDSKATNPDACIQALHSFPGRPLLLLAGGKDKGTDLTEWAKACYQHANTVILFGSAAQRLQEALTHEASAQAGRSLNLLRVETLQEAWQLALLQVPVLGAAPVLLFSPACASFDQFLDFEDRGQRFKAMVKQYLSNQQWLEPLSAAVNELSLPLPEEPQLQSNASTVPFNVSAANEVPIKTLAEQTLQGSPQ